MGMLFKTIIAFCIGLAALTAVQHLWVSSMMGQVRTATATLPSLQSQVTGLPSFDTDKLRKGLFPTVGPIDTREGQRLAIEGAQRRIDMQIRGALSAVPRPPSMPNIPGVRR